MLLGLLDGGLGGIGSFELGAFVAADGLADRSALGAVEVEQQGVVLVPTGSGHADFPRGAGDFDGVLAVAEVVLGETVRQRVVADMGAEPVVGGLVTDEGEVKFAAGRVEGVKVGDLQLDFGYV